MTVGTVGYQQSRVKPVSVFTSATRHSNHSREISTRHPPLGPNSERVMRPMFGRTKASATQDVWKYARRLSAFPRPAHKKQINSKLWMCQRCYHHNQRALDSKQIQIAQGHDRQRIQAPRIAFSESHSRALSTGNSDAGEKPRSDLPSQEEGRRSHISKRFSHVMDHLQSNIFIAGQRLNDLTGYSGIEALKKDIEQQGQPPTPH